MCTQNIVANCMASFNLADIIKRSYRSYVLWGYGVSGHYFLLTTLKFLLTTLKHTRLSASCVSDFYKVTSGWIILTNDLSNVHYLYTIHYINKGSSLHQSFSHLQSTPPPPPSAFLWNNITWMYEGRYTSPNDESEEKRNWRKDADAE